jgi:hypothetical protein
MTVAARATTVTTRPVLVAGTRQASLTTAAAADDAVSSSSTLFEQLQHRYLCDGPITFDGTAFGASIYPHILGAIERPTTGHNEQFRERVC